MKILYITPKINNEGGVAKVLSVKTNYLIEKLGYQVALITQNRGNLPLFFSFNQKINVFDFQLSNNKLKLILDYKNQVSSIIKHVNPDVIVVSDNGLKGFLFPFIINTKIPIVFEVHGSKFNEEHYYKKNTVTSFFHKLKYKIRNYGASKFDYFIALSNESALEWNIKNTTIIPNPIEISHSSVSKLNSNKVIFVGRHSYEKGVDRLLKIWKLTAAKYPNWMLEIYGKSDNNRQYIKLSKELELGNSIFFSEPITAIHEKYLEASLCIMTSRNEGFPMVLLEAMNAGLPIVAFDCPVGPKSILTNNEDGFLIDDGNFDDFVSKLSLLIEEGSLRKKMGENAKKNVSKYNLDEVMNQWKVFFETLKHR